MAQELRLSAGEAVAAARGGPRSLTAFLVVAAGQVVSMFGSELTGFVLGVWIFQQTGSTTAFAMMAFAVAVPGILVSPLAGALVDRWDRRWAMVLGDTGAGLGTLLLVLLAWTDHLAIGWIYLVVAVSAAFQAFQFPALSASIPLLVPQRHLGRANGFMEVGTSGGALLAPLTAGVLLAAIGLEGVFLLDLTTFSIAVIAVLAVRIPRPPRVTEAAEQSKAKASLLREAVWGWKYIHRRPGLFALLGLFAGVNFTQGFVLVLLTPLVLSFASPAALGTVMSVAGLGVMCGGLFMSVTGGPRRRVRGIFLCFLVQGLILFLGGLKPSVPLVAVAAFFYSLCSPVIIALSQSIWQSKVAVDVQGRVFAMRQVVSMSFMPLAFLLAGPLADRVFEPLMAAGGALAGSVGRLIGTGPGRGVGLLFLVLGALTLGILVLAASYPRLRRLETELPDAVAAEEESDG